ncbi:MAG: hypothetical protein FWF47_03645 [Clostridia bacterium]|nr:hypothetical protein [Clostridia bacterium]
MILVIEILEAATLFCFGFGWPFSIYKSYKARANTGKSLLFLFVIWLGYLLGIARKLIEVPHDFTLWLYVVNISMVSCDIALYYRNKKLVKHDSEPEGYPPSDLSQEYTAHTV